MQILDLMSGLLDCETRNPIFTDGSFSFSYKSYNIIYSLAYFTLTLLSISVIGFKYYIEDLVLFSS